MNTRTDLANYALSYIGEGATSDINDQNSKAARTAKQFMPDTIDEVLRAGRWNEATDRATLTALAQAPNFDYQYAYELPVDFIRLLEVNGEQFERSQQFFEIEAGKRLVSNRNTCKIRYIKRIDVPDFGPQLAEAIAIKLATKLIIPLGTNMDRQNTLIQMYDRAVKQARFVDAVETGNRENPMIIRALQSSPLVNARYYGRYDHLNYLHPFRY